MNSAKKQDPATLKGAHTRMVQALKGGQVYILGDSMIDEYWHSSVERFSPEAPVPISLVQKVTKTLGGAANVLHNISSLGGSGILISRLGKDPSGKEARQLLKKHGPTGHIWEDQDVQTTRKIRVLTGSHHMLRIDHEDTRPSKAIEDKILDTLKKLPRGSILIVSDYNKGVITENVAKEISKLAKRGAVKVLVDPTPTTIGKIKGAYLLKPNRTEAEAILGKKIKDDLSNIKEFGLALRRKTESENVLITLGKDGMALWSKNGLVKKPTMARKIFDVSGAGDTVIATIALAIASGVDLMDAMDLANAAAGVVVEKLGTATCTPDELLNHLATSNI